jgi:DNA-binding NarL/FixJ family response regulator
MRRILIVEDVGETRRWLSTIVTAAFDDCEICEAANMRLGLDLVTCRDFDLALIDLGLPDGSGLEVLRSLQQLQPDAIAIVTTIMGDDAHIVAALSAGAQGYLLKESSPELLTRQLIQLSKGIPAVSPSIARRIMHHFRLTGPSDCADESLTDREREVLAYISRGLRNIDVAEALSLSPSTIASHIKSIYRKLGISSRAEATWHATRMGLSPTETKRDR